MTGFEPAKLRSLTVAAVSAMHGSATQQACLLELGRYTATHYDAIVAAMTAGGGRAAQLRDTTPTDDEVDFGLVSLGFDAAERYPEYSHEHLRAAYREGWQDALMVATAAVRGDAT